MPAPERRQQAERERRTARFVPDAVTGYQRLSAFAVECLPVQLG
jgi:hypothetical protein